MRIELARLVGQATLGGGDASAHMNDLALCIYSARLHRNSSHVVDLEFERRIGCTSGQHGLHNTTQSRVQQSGYHPSVHRAKRVVMVLCRFNGEYSTPLTHLAYPHTHAYSDRRGRP